MAPPWITAYLERFREAPLIELKRLMLFLAIVTLPMGHLFGIVFFLGAAALSLPTVQWRFGGVATSLYLPLVASYGLIVGAELLSPNSFATTLETAFNYLPLLLLPLLFAGCWHSGIDVQYITQSIIIASVGMLLMALAEVFLFGQGVADGNVLNMISIAPKEFALVAFLYGLIITSAAFLNREPFINRIKGPFIALGLLSCLICVWLSGSGLLWMPILVAALTGLFGAAFNSRRRWLTPTLLVVLVLVGVGLSSLPAVQTAYGNWFMALNDSLGEGSRTTMLAQQLSKWLAGWQMAQDAAFAGHGNIHATGIALSSYKLDDWPPFHVGLHFNSGFLDHFVLFGASGLAGLLIILTAPLVVVGPGWFRLYAAIVVLATTLYAMFGRFMNNDITGAAMLTIWLTLLLTQSLVERKQA